MAERYEGRLEDSCQMTIFLRAAAWQEALDLSRKLDGEATSHPSAESSGVMSMRLLSFFKIKQR